MSEVWTTNKYGHILKDFEYKGCLSPKTAQEIVTACNAKIDNDKLKAFARKVITYEGLEIDGCDIEEWGTELGLLYLTAITQEDKDNDPEGLSFGDFEVGDPIYKFTELLEEL